MESTNVVHAGLFDVLVLVHVPTIAAIAAFTSLHVVQKGLHPQI